MTDYRNWSGAAGGNGWGTAGNWDTAPVSTNGVNFPAMAAASTKDVAGSDQSAVLLVSLCVEAGNYLNFGSRLAPLIVDTDYFEFRGLGARSFWNVLNCADMRILSGVSASSGYGYGTHLTSTAVTLLVVNPAAGGGSNASISLAALGGESAAFTTMMLQSGEITVGAAVTCTTCNVSGGTIQYNSDVTTMNVSGGTVTVARNNPTTLNIQGGRVYYNSADVPTTINLYEGGLLDLTQDQRAKTLTVNLYGGTISCRYGQLDGSTVNIKGGGTLQVA